MFITPHFSDCKRATVIQKAPPVMRNPVECLLEHLIRTRAQQLLNTGAHNAVQVKEEGDLPESPDEEKEEKRSPMGSSKTPSSS